MRLWTIFRFEFSYSVRRPWPWAFALIIVGLSFLMTRDGSVAEVLYAEFFLNSPFSVAKTTVFGSLLWLVMAAAIAGDAAARDVESGMHPLAYTVPVRKIEYLGGKFLAAFGLNALILLSVQVGILLGVYLPGVDAELIGPFRPAAFLTAYGFISIPNALAATAIQFLLASTSGRAMAAYFGSFLIVFMGFFVSALLLYNTSFGTLLDPVGVRFLVEDIARLWTPVEKNSRLLTLEGLVLHNRLVWLAVAAAACLLSYATFRFKHRTGLSVWKRFVGRSKSIPEQQEEKVIELPVRVIQSHGIASGFAVSVRQTMAIMWASFKSIAFSWGGIALLVVIPIITIPVVVDQMYSTGIALVPITARVIIELTGSLADELSRWVIIPFLIIYFTGELVWREREARLGEIVDTMPGSDWAPFVGKFLGLALVLVVFLALQIAAGIAGQTILGYDKYEIGLYVKIMLGLQLYDYLLFALLGLVLHVVANQKYMGHLLAVIAFVVITIASLFGIEHNMLIYGAGPSWSYNEMRGFGDTVGPWLWFKLYWTGWALLLTVVGKLLWVRGKESNFGKRIQMARARLKGTTMVVAAVAFVVVAGIGGFVFYNTNVLNNYESSTDIKDRSASYERQYGKFKNSPKPALAGTTLNIEVYPEKRMLDIRGTYELVNLTDSAIDTLHIATASGVKTEIRGGFWKESSVLDEKLGRNTYVLTTPLHPGDSLLFEFTVHVERHGFSESGVNPSLAHNASYFSNKILPAIGYQHDRELIHASDRRDYELPPRQLIASLDDIDARKKESAGTLFKAVMGTSNGQVAVAPGRLTRTWEQNNRQYFQYETSAPIGNEWTFFSANYTVRKDGWRSPTSDSSAAVEILVFHHPQHDRHVERTLSAIKESLTYYSNQFGPYRYNHLTVVELPGLGAGMHADASMISHPEGFTAWDPDPSKHDHPYAIVAHETAHQWTVPYAPVEGAPVMSESIAWYYGLKMVEHSRGRDELKRLLHFMRQPYPYPAIHRGEPLLRGLDPYLSYRRGPFALYTISEYIGEDRVNVALRRLLEDHRRPESPLATTLDLYGELKSVTPDSLQYLLRDLFEVNTYWELKAEKAAARQLETGNWEVTIDIRASKIVEDSAGVKSQVPMNDWVEFGIVRESGEEATELRRVISGKQTVTLIVADRPTTAWIDPNHLMIDLDPDDNSCDVTAN